MPNNVKMTATTKSMAIKAFCVRLRYTIMVCTAGIMNTITTSSFECEFVSLFVVCKKALAHVREINMALQVNSS